MGEFRVLTLIQLRELRTYFLFSSFFPNMISFLFKLLIFYNINNINLIYIWNKINFIIIKYPICFERGGDSEREGDVIFLQWSIREVMYMYHITCKDGILSKQHL